MTKTRAETTQDAQLADAARRLADQAPPLDPATIARIAQLLRTRGR